MFIEAEAGGVPGLWGGGNRGGNSGGKGGKIGFVGGGGGGDGVKPGITNGGKGGNCLVRLLSFFGWSDLRSHLGFCEYWVTVVIIVTFTICVSPCVCGLWWVKWRGGC